MTSPTHEWPHILIMANEPIGDIGEFYGDGLCLVADFKARAAYARWADDFSESIRLLKAGERVLHRKRMDHIFDAQLAITNHQGEILYKRTPGVVIKGEIGFLHIEDGLLRLRTF